MVGILQALEKGERWMVEKDQDIRRIKGPLSGAKRAPAHKSTKGSDTKKSKTLHESHRLPSHTKTGGSKSKKGGKQKTMELLRDRISKAEQTTSHITCSSATSQQIHSRRSLSSRFTFHRRRFAGQHRPLVADTVNQVHNAWRSAAKCLISMCFEASASNARYTFISPDGHSVEAVDRTSTEQSMLPVYWNKSIRIERLLCARGDEYPIVAAMCSERKKEELNEWKYHNHVKDNKREMDRAQEEESKYPENAQGQELNSETAKCMLIYFGHRGPNATLIECLPSQFATSNFMNEGWDLLIFEKEQKHPTQKKARLRARCHSVLAQVTALIADSIAKEAKA